MNTNAPISATELTDLLGELEPYELARLESIQPSFDQVTEAIALLQEEAEYGVAHEPSSGRVLAVLQLLEDMMWDQVEPAAGHDYAAHA